jgi:DNA-binding response OmpR family regulator
MASKKRPADPSAPLLEEKRKALEAGVDDDCVKPCTPDELIAMIKRHLREA